MDILKLIFLPLLFVASLSAIPSRLGFERYLRKPRLRDRIYALLTAEFFQLEAGDRFYLTEKEIGHILAVPRSAVREALSRLELEGVVELRPGVGIVVTNPDGIKIDNETIEHYYDIRKLIKFRNARIAAIKKPEDLEDNLENCLLAMRGAERGMSTLERGSDEFESMVRQLSGFDVRFHTLIAEVTGDDFTQDILEMILAILLPNRRLSLDTAGRLAEILVEHDEIKNKIVSGDPDGASRAMEHHIDQVSKVRRKPRNS